DCSVGAGARPPALPSRDMQETSRLEKAQQFCLWSVGATFGAVGLVSLLAFVAPGLASLLPFALRTPMSFNTTIAMLWLAVAFPAAAFERRQLALCCVAGPVLIGTLSLLQNLLLPGLHIDEVLMVGDRSS